MSEHHPSRRAMLKGAVAASAAAAMLTLPASTEKPDPLCALVSAYRAERAWLNSTSGDIPDDSPMPVWDALNESRIPTATSKEGAVEALRLAVEMCDELSGADAIPNLVEAALYFLEGATI